MGDIKYGWGFEGDRGELFCCFEYGFGGQYEESRFGAISGAVRGYFPGELFLYSMGYLISLFSM